MRPKLTSIVGRCLKKFRWLFPAAALALVYGYWLWSNRPVNPTDQIDRAFVVPQGQSTGAIAQRLKQERLIRSPLAFRLLVDRKGLSGRLQAGDFQLSPAMDLGTIINSLTHSSQDFWITFPEGLRTEEYAERLAAKSSLDTKAFIVAAKPFEGRLFPDTYSIPITASSDDVVKLLTDTFIAKSPAQDKTAIIIASLIEREAKHQEDRRLVSSVIHNRLEIGMALQIDATVQYVLGRPGRWWPDQLTRDDLRTGSAYNTYLNSGLPPAPIANPGLESLRAAQTPAETDYLYYVSDSGGYNHYAKTLAEHQANIEQYLID